MIKATNTPDNIYKPFSYQKTYTFKVWARDVKVAKPTIRRIYYHDSIATLALFFNPLNETLPVSTNSFNLSL